MKYSRSKKLAWAILSISTILSTYAIYSNLEGAAIAFWSVGVPAAAGLYANKQYQDRKFKEIENKN